MKVRCRYTVTYDATFEVPDDATHRQIGEELANLNIPEDENSTYHSDTFEPEMALSPAGMPQLFTEDGDPTTLEEVRAEYEEQQRRDEKHGLHGPDHGQAQ